MGNVARPRISMHLIEAGFMQIGSVGFPLGAGWPCGVPIILENYSTVRSGLEATNLYSPFGLSNSSRRCSGATALLGRVSVDMRIESDKFERLWRSLLSDPSQWWDNRAGKPNARFPDFKHKQTGEGLWVTHSQNPRWVEVELAYIAPGVSICSRAQTLSKFNKAQLYQKTLEHFEQMQLNGIVVDRYVFVQVLNACAALESLEKGQRIHKQIIEAGCELNLHVGSALVHMYAKCGSIDKAFQVFDRMRTRDVVAWTVMIQGFVTCGEALKALDLFNQMQEKMVEPSYVTFLVLVRACASIGALEEGRRVHELMTNRGFEASGYLGNSLVDMYAKCGSVDEAWSVFTKLPARDKVSWTAMILGCVQAGEGGKALQLFRQMQREKTWPDRVTYVALLNACASLGAIDDGRRVHEQIIRSGLEYDVYVSNSLVDMYSKCGAINEALTIFNKMPLRDVVGWNSMLTGYAMHGLAKEAVALFEQMSAEDAKVDGVTFVCLLSACSHGGLVKEGKQYFDSMWSVYGVPPAQEHYNCLVDILGRAGYLSDAEAVITTMPLEPCAATWKSLLSACRIHGNVEIAERASKRVLELDPTNAAGYVLLANVYAAAGQWERKAMVQEQKILNRIMKQPGRTWIEVNKEFHSFVVNDSQHPQIQAIHEELSRLSKEMKDSGYVPDTGFALHDVDEEKKLDHLSRHSEKLAIAFGLISTPDGTPLCIVKNPRVCGDCHTAIKFISKIVGRHITVRDANRFHQFNYGLCSCGDY